MVALPIETALANPLPLTVTTEGTLEVQAAEFVTSPTEPSENVAEALNCWVLPPIMPESDSVALDGFTVILLMVLLLTVTLAVADALPDLAVMVVFPKATPVTKPVLLIVAMLVDEDDQVTRELTSAWVLLPKVPVAVNCCVLVGLIQAPVGDKEMETISLEEGKNPPQLPIRRAIEITAAI